MNHQLSDEARKVGSQPDYENLQEIQIQILQINTAREMIE